MKSDESLSAWNMIIYHFLYKYINYLKWRVWHPSKLLEANKKKKVALEILINTLEDEVKEKHFPASMCV